MFPLQFTASKTKISAMFIIPKTEQVEQENQVTVADGGHKKSLLSHQKLLECYA